MKHLSVFIILFLFCSFVLYSQASTGASPRNVIFAEYQTKVEDAMKGSGPGAGHVQFFIKGPFEVRRNPDVMLTQDMLKNKVATDGMTAKTFDPNDMTDSNIDEWEKTASIDWEATLEPKPFTAETYNSAGKKKTNSTFWDIYEDYSLHKKWTTFPMDAVDLATAKSDLAAAKTAKIKNAAPGANPYWMYKYNGKWYSYKKVEYQWEFTNFQRVGQSPNVSYQTLNDVPSPKIFDSKTYDPMAKKIQKYIHVKAFDPGIRLLPTTPKELEWVFGKMQRVYYTLTYTYTEYNDIEEVLDTNGKAIGFKPKGAGTTYTDVKPELFNAFDYRTGVKKSPNEPDSLEALGKQYGTTFKTGYAAVYIEDYLPPASDPAQTLVNNSASSASANSKEPIFVGKDAALNKQAGPSGKFSMVLEDNGIASNNATISYGIGKYDIYWLVDPSKPSSANDEPIAYLPAVKSSIGPYMGSLKNTMHVNKRIPKLRERRLYLGGSYYQRLKGAAIKIVDNDGDLMATEIPLTNPQTGEKDIFGSGEVSVGNEDILFPKNSSQESCDPPNETSKIEIQVSDCCSNSSSVFEARIVYYDDIRPNIEVKVTVPVKVRDESDDDGEIDGIREKLYYRTVPNDHRATAWPAKYNSGYWPYSTWPEDNRIGVSQYTEIVQPMLQNTDPCRKKDEVKYGIWINNDEVWNYDHIKNDGWYPDKDGNDFLAPLVFPEDLRVKLEILARDNIDGYIAHPKAPDGSPMEEVYGISRMEIEVLNPEGHNITKLIYSKDTVILKREEMLEGLEKGGWGQYSEYINISSPGYHILVIKVWDGNENITNADDNFSDPVEGILGNYRELRLPLLIKKTGDSLSIHGVSN